MIAAYRHALATSTRTARLLLANSAIMGFAVDGGIYSVIFNLYLLRLAFGPEFVGQVNSLANLAFAVGCLLAGWLGTRWGARRTMIAGLSIVLTGAVAVPMTDAVPAAWRGPWITASFVLAYGGLSLYYVNSGPFLLRATPRAARGNIFALQSAAGAVASFAGGLLGGFLPALVATMLGLALTEPGPYRVPLMLASGMLGLALFVVLQTREITVEETAQPVDGASGGGAPTVVAASGLVLFLGVVRFLQVAGIGAGATFFNVYMDESLGVATAQIGVIASSARLVAVPMALLGPTLSRRIGFGATAILASLLSALFILPLALIPTAGAAGVGFIGLLAFTSMRYPAFYVYMMERTPDRLRAMMNGVNEMAAGLSFALMALAGGYIIVAYGYAAAFLAGAALTLLGTLIFAVYVWRHGEMVARR